MPISLSTARYLAPLSFLYDFAAQQYGINATPSMKAIHDDNLSYFSPQPYFIAAFFFPQQCFQLAWLWKLWRLDERKPEEKRQLDEIVKFVPYYAIGNACIGTWMFFWQAEKFGWSNVFVIVNTLTQLWYVFTQLERMNTKSVGSVLTHVVAKTFAGIGVLDILHNSSVAYALGSMEPSALVKILTGLGFAGMSAVSDWIFGGCLVYDLVGLSVGQSMYSKDGSWSTLLGAFAVGSAAIVGLRNYFKPPYVSDGEYVEASQEEDRV